MHANRRAHVLGSMRWLGVALCACISTACGSTSDDASPSETQSDPCSLAVTLSGEIGLQTAGNPLRCAGTLAMGPEFQVIFIPDKATGVQALDIAIVGPNQAEVGAIFSTFFTINLSDGRAFRAFDCSAAVTTNQLLRAEAKADRYHVAGNGSCAEDATALGGAQIRVGPFEFDTTVSWQH